MDQILLNGSNTVNSAPLFFSPWAEINPTICSQQVINTLDRSRNKPATKITESLQPHQTVVQLKSANVKGKIGWVIKH